MNDSQNPGCSSAQGSATLTPVPATPATSQAGQRRPAWRNPHAQRQHADSALGGHTPARQCRIRQGQQQAAGACRVRRGPTQHRARPTPPQAVGRARGQPGEQGDVQAADAHQVGHPRSDERCPSRVHRSPTGRPLPARPAHRPRAANRPAAAGHRAAAGARPPASRPGCHSRGPDTRWAGCSPPSCTDPTAPTPCSNNQSSASKPSGLSVPCGRFKRTASCQASPATTGTVAPEKDASPAERWSQPSQRWRGTWTGRPA